MNKNTENRQKLKTRDIFTVVLLALINVVLFFASSLLYATPITIILMPIFFSLIEGIVFFIIGNKVQKCGAIMIYCVVRGILGRILTVCHTLSAGGHDRRACHVESTLWKCKGLDNFLHDCSGVRQYRQHDLPLCNYLSIFSRKK